MRLEPTRARPTQPPPHIHSVSDPRELESLAAVGLVFSWGDGEEGKLGLGDVVVEQNRVSLNGEPVAGLSRADVVALCTRKPVIQ